jgi:hypothetical protein
MIDQADTRLTCIRHPEQGYRDASECNRRGNIDGGHDVAVAFSAKEQHAGTRQ